MTLIITGGAGGGGGGGIGWGVATEVFPFLLLRVSPSPWQRKKEGGGGEGEGTVKFGGGGDPRVAFFDRRLREVVAFQFSLSPSGGRDRIGTISTPTCVWRIFFSGFQFLIFGESLFAEASLPHRQDGL